MERKSARSSAGFAQTPARTSMPEWYTDLLRSVTGHITAGRRRAVAAANGELLLTYWAVGKEILDRQGREGYGTKVVDRLSADIKRQLPDASGFSPRNLKYMRAFAAAWPDRRVVQGTLAQLPWYHQIALMEKLGDEATRLWYAAVAIEQGWSRDVLALQIKSRLHERSGRAVTNFKSALPDEDSDLAQQSSRASPASSACTRPRSTICLPIPTTSPPSACCCARPRMMSWPSTRCEGIQRPSGWPSGRLGSPPSCLGSWPRPCPVLKPSRLSSRR